MKTLYLLRHAKSAWDRADLPDHERPLNQRGRDACKVLAEYWRRHHVLPAIVLCSSAARTQETLSRIADALDRDINAKVTEDLYMAEPKALLAAIRALDDNFASAMIIGHNPGLGELARQLTGSGGAHKVASLAEKFPTGGLATLSFDVSAWSKIKPGRGLLKDYVTPRTLET